MNGFSLKVFVIAFLIFILTDMIWLGFIAKNLYFEQYHQWLRLSQGQLKPIWWSALLVYMLFALSIVVFIMPLANTSLMYAAIYGALLGAIIYGVYDFTCLAIFRDFPMGMAFIDWIWGIVLYSWSSMTTLYLAGYLK
ncbi:DUF2177 family protein [Legionella israelensis]|uniref:Membrane protein n=1 Tax=Legionella israelensis TaxID=454 RepID=A0A0W0VJG0_9GAMM|nr:DUF2177 family protein [Legionella israelensis]KTD20227.1 membrane protein [Legionella israelensis]QBS09013.1 DUF2177 family protein [Legionella israelensis]SCY39758.1 Uncharacterized membrane protein [Legionella israelensis DSM 19235]STX58719.1 membrane protein [Legionella israelensis]